MLHLGMGILYIRTNGSLGCKINNIILIEKKNVLIDSLKIYILIKSILSAFIHKKKNP